MPKRRDYSQFNRPSVSWVNVPTYYHGPRIIRVHSGIIQTPEELENFISSLRAYAEQGATDVVKYAKPGKPLVSADRSFNVTRRLK